MLNTKTLQFPLLSMLMGSDIDLVADDSCEAGVIEESLSIICTPSLRTKVELNLLNSLTSEPTLSVIISPHRNAIPIFGNTVVINIQCEFNDQLNLRPIEVIDATVYGDYLPENPYSAPESYDDLPPQEVAPITEYIKGFKMTHFSKEFLEGLFGIQSSRLVTLVHFTRRNAS